MATIEVASSAARSHNETFGLGAEPENLKETVMNYRRGAKSAAHDGFGNRARVTFRVRPTDPKEGLQRADSLRSLRLCGFLHSGFQAEFGVPMLPYHGDFGCVSPVCLPSEAYHADGW